MKKIYLSILTVLAIGLSYATTHTISNSGTSFSPDSIAIAVGDDINFAIGASHDAKQYEGIKFNNTSFSASDVTTNGFSVGAGGGTVSHLLFSIPGTYYYVCQPHFSLGMKGKITVQHTTSPADCSDLFFSQYMEGSSSNKAIEIFNPTSATIDLSNYTLVMYNNGGNAVNSLALTGTIAANDVFVIANANANIAGSADLVNGIINHNGDDAYALVKNGVGAIDIIGIFDIDPGSEWSVGSGSTKDNTLTRIASVKAGTTDWNISQNQWTVTPTNDTTGFGSHTILPCGGAPQIIVAPTTATINEGDASAVVATFNVSPAVTNASTFDISITGGNGTAADISETFPQTVNVTNTTTSIDFTITPVDDNVYEGNDTIIFTISNLTGDLTMGTDSVFTLIIEDNDVPALPITDIATVRTDDGNGNPTNLGQTYRIVGVANSPERGFRSTEFSMFDATGAITIYNGGNSISYEAVVGDSVEVFGTVGQRFGVTILTDITVINKLDSNITVNPTVASKPEEANESSLIRINNIFLVNQSQWTAAGGAGFDVEAYTLAGDSIQIRIDRDYSELYNLTTPPCDTFDLVGVAGQFDENSPYTEGYQIIPRFLTDILNSTPCVTPPSSVTIAQATDVDANGEPTLAIGTAVELRGIVTSPDFKAKGVEFTFADATGGVWAYSSDSIIGLNYNPVVGDSVYVKGTIGFSKGANRIYIDSVKALGTATPFTPTVVNVALTEAHEAELIKIENLTLSGTWQSSGGSYNVNATSDAGITYDIRVDMDRAELYNVPLTQGQKFNLTGVGAQYKQSAPYTDGYQIMPRFEADIELVQDTGNAIEDVNLAQLSIYPNPTSTTLNIALESNENQKATILIVDVLGKVVFNEVNTLNNGKNTLAIDVNHLAKGTYALTIATAKGTHTEQVIVK